jgi:hypothetical protein
VLDGPNYTLTVLTVALSTIGALVGSAAGSTLAIRQFKKQKAFERRVEWYEEAVRALYTLKSKIEVWLHHDQTGNAAGEEEARNDILAFLIPLSVTLSSRTLYAKRASREAIAIATTAINALGSGVAQHAGPDRSSARRSAAIKVFMTLDSAAAVLANELRAEMGWEVIEPPSPPEAAK